MGAVHGLAIIPEPQSILILAAASFIAVSGRRAKVRMQNCAPQSPPTIDPMAHGPSRFVPIQWAD